MHNHLMAVNQANHLLPLEAYFLTSLLEEHKEGIRLRRRVIELHGLAKTAPFRS